MTSTHPGHKALTAKGRATRERIVGAAATLMFTNGVARTSLDDVKASAGVSSSQLYHYFVDKHALVMAVISHQTEAVLDGQQPHLAALDSMAARHARPLSAHSQLSRGLSHRIARQRADGNRRGGAHAARVELQAMGREHSQRAASNARAR
jgi:AcrR family transcriptional regulator